MPDPAHDPVPARHLRLWQRAAVTQVVCAMVALVLWLLRPPQGLLVGATYSFCIGNA